MHRNTDTHFHVTADVANATEAKRLDAEGAEKHPHLGLARKIAHDVVADLAKRDRDAGLGYHVTIGSTVPEKGDPIAEQITVTVQIPREHAGPDPEDVAAAEKALAEIGGG